MTRDGDGGVRMICNDCMLEDSTLGSLRMEMEDGRWRWRMEMLDGDGGWRWRER